MHDENKGIQDVLSTIMRDATDLIRKEFRLFLLEMRKAVTAAYVAVFMAVGAFIFGLVALVFAGEALLEWLAAIFGSRIQAAMAVAVIMALVATVLAFLSYRRFIGARFVPRKTLASLRATRSAFFGRFPDE